MGTNNPSDEQLELVESRIIELADSCVDPGLPIESDSYFEEHGFDIESAAGQLTAKLKAYCRDADVAPSIEDHPQVRRMARYLLENVDYDILSAPISSELLKSKPKSGGSTSGGGGGGGGGGLTRGKMAVAAVLLVLALFLIYFFVLSGGGEEAPPALVGGGRIRGGRAHRGHNHS